MKVIAFILSILFFSLAVVPCSDAHTCDGEHLETTHDHSEDENDACSPLCFCSCCGTAFTIPQLGPVDIILYAPSIEDTFLYQYDYTYHFSTSIWHPPLRA